ncbi:MAG TPA: hypothetical protein VKY85_13555 [Candidatus Angelobacter sp.]|nr:hypothetical protein [Candidatus Angelobacter sp.]
MKTITEIPVQINGASLQVELKSGNEMAVPMAVVTCGGSSVAPAASVYSTQLRGYSW